MKQKLGFIQGAVYCKKYNANNNNNTDFSVLLRIFLFLRTLVYILSRHKLGPPADIRSAASRAVAGY